MYIKLRHKDTYLLSKLSYLFILICTDLFLLMTFPYIKMSIAKEQKATSMTVMNSISPSTDQVIVATITYPDGTTLDIDQTILLAAHQQAQANQSLETTLQQVIDLYILEHQAQSQHLDQAPTVKDETARAALRHFIHDEFEKTYRLETLPQTYIDQATKQNIGLFKHPELRKGVHILLKPLHSQTTPMTKEQKAILSPFAQKVSDDLAKLPIKNAQDLQKRVQRYQSWLPQNYEVIFENLGRFSRTGPFIPTFYEPCFAQQQVPAIVGPIITPFGIHFAWLEEIIPPLDTPMHEIEQEVKQRILPEVRSYEWRMLLSKLLEQAEQNEHQP